MSTPVSLDPSTPPEFGEIHFELATAPVSQQASGDAKAALREQVRAITRPLQYLIDSEVQLEIEWFVHERFRWETDASPDVDNIIKPLLDGLCGPEGLLVDDCQVQRVGCSWIDWNRDDQKLAIHLKFPPDSYLMKDGLVFARVQQAMCFPVPRDVQKKALGLWLDALEHSLAGRKKLTDLTGSYYPARYVLPTGFIHVSRLRGFKVVPVEDLRRQVE